MDGSGTSILRVCLDSRDLSLNFMVRNWELSSENFSDSNLGLQEEECEDFNLRDDRRRLVDLGVWKRDLPFYFALSQIFGLFFLFPF